MAILDYNNWDQEKASNFRDMFAALMEERLEGYRVELSPLEDSNFEVILSGYIRPDFLSYPEEKRRLMLEASEYVGGLTYPEFIHLWEGLLPPFSLGEEAWVRFLNRTRETLSQDML